MENAKRILIELEWVRYNADKLDKHAQRVKAIEGKFAMGKKAFLAEWVDGNLSKMRIKTKEPEGACTCEEWEKNKQCNHILYFWRKAVRTEYVVKHGEPKEREEMTDEELERFFQELGGEEDIYAEADEITIEDIVDIEELGETEDKPEEIPEAETPKKEEPVKAVNLYDFFLNLLEGEPDLVEIFGETGSCKSAIALQLLKDAEAKGKKTLFIDTEGNLRPKQRPKNYFYTPTLSELKKLILKREGLKDGYDVVILDSIGIPVLGAYAVATLRQRGDMLLGMQAIAYTLKSYARRNNCLVLIANQPISELSAMSIEDQNEREKAIYERRPFGDKMSFMIKEVLRTRQVVSKREYTIVDVEAWRSRKYGRGTKLFSLKIDSKGVQVGVF